MFRRTFLKLTTGLLGASTASRIGSAASSANDLNEISFYVAGVRFHQSIPGITRGEAVRIIAKNYGGERCYEIFVGGQKIGFAPRKAIPVLNKLTALGGRISSFNPNAVPWKRYRITMLA
jgi:hypothetical protein